MRRCQMSDRLYDPRTHSDWLSPHSIEWYAHLGEATGQYSYPWGATMTEPNGETMFEQEVTAMVTNKTVLDIGCGHGEFTKRWSGVVKKIVGLDVTNDFVQVGRTDARQNVLFVVANTKNSLPFARAAFDCAYNRRGPTSAYLDVKRVIKSGGRLLGLHPGDRLGEELSRWFPTLFEPRPAGTPVLDILKQRLAQGGLGHAEIETVSSIQYLQEPIDIINMRCFGQKRSVFEAVKERCLPEILQIFERHATEDGLPTAFEQYIVYADI